MEFSAPTTKELTQLTPEEKFERGIELTLSERQAMNGRKGGRPPGSKNPETIKKEAALKEYRGKVIEVADVLFAEQLHLAKGVSYLYKIEKELIVGPQGGKKYINSKPKIVTSQQEIENYLMEKFVNGDVEDENDPNATYYFITAEKGDSKTIDSMFNRVFGTPTKTIVTEDEEGNKQAIVGNIITFVDNSTH